MAEKANGKDKPAKPLCNPDDIDRDKHRQPDGVDRNVTVVAV